MKAYKALVRELLAECTGTLRKSRDLTQEELAEQLRITGRAYGDLERGKYCFSTITLLFLLLSALATGLSWLCYFKALQLGDVSRVAPVDKLSVPLAMILAMLFLHEPVSLKVIVGGLLITAGSLVLLL